MKIIIENSGPGEEESITLRCREVDPSLVELLNRIKTEHIRLTGIRDGEIFRLEPREVYYFEAVDNRVYLYTQTQVYETKWKLYEIERELGGGDFFRASKSVIVNLSRVKSLRPAFSGRMEALLQNGERIIISRQYVKELKERLGV